MTTLVLLLASAVFAQEPAVDVSSTSAVSAAASVAVSAPAAEVEVSTEPVRLSSGTVELSTAAVRVSTGAVDVSTFTLAVSTIPLPAATGAAGSVRLLSIGDYPAVTATPYLLPFEQVLSERRAEIDILDMDNVPAYFNGGAYRYRLPETTEPGAEPSTGAAKVAALESEYGFFLLWPAEPRLMAAALEAFRQPERYRVPITPRIGERQASLLVAPAAEGGWVHSAEIQTPRPAAGQWRKTVATVFRLRIGGRLVEAVFIPKTLGGLARLATALAEEKAAGPAIVVSRGRLTARDVSEALHGRAWFDSLERVGLSVSAVGLGELREWQDLVAYRRDRPEGIEFVSANLVWSSSPTTRPLPAFAVRESEGVRVGFLGLTRPSYSKFLAAGRWKALSVVDPVAPALAQIRELREHSDLVVLLSNLDESDTARVAEQVRGIDVILALEEPGLPVSGQPKSMRATEPARTGYQPALLTATEYRGAITRADASLGARLEDGSRRLELSISHRALDESVVDRAGYPEYSLDAYGVAGDTNPALVPSARKLWPYGARPGSFVPTLSARDFWTLAAALAADRARAEVGVLPAPPIGARPSGDYRESQVREWFVWDDGLLAVELPGRALAQLVALSAAQPPVDERRATGEPRAFVVAGVSSDGKVHGAPIDPDTVYRVAVSELLLGNADLIPPLSQAQNVEPIGPLRQEVLAALRRAAAERWPNARYRGLMEGAPVRETGVWRVNFRDISANVTNTHVVKDGAAFAQVPNSRVQGFDQEVVGLTAKTDADYSYLDYRWSNSFALEYSKARLHPPGSPEVVNTPNNRIDLQTTLTRRVGGVPWGWLARSYGPSLGLEYEGQVENAPGLRRKEIYSALPGVEFFDGTVVQTLQLSGSIKRDFSRLVPNNQYGLRQRLVLSAPIRAGIRLQGETLVRYFFLTPRDSPEDLRLETDVQLKLMIPLYKQLTLAPFADLYAFQLKTSPASGYSFLTGISVGFSRLWKPGYERF